MPADPRIYEKQVVPIARNPSRWTFSIAASTRLMPKQDFTNSNASNVKDIVQNKRMISCIFRTIVSFRVIPKAESTVKHSFTYTSSQHG